MTFEALRKFEAGILKKIIPVLHRAQRKYLVGKF